MKKIFTTTIVAIILSTSFAFAQSTTTASNTASTSPITINPPALPVITNFVSLGVNQNEIKSGESVRLSWTSDGVRLKIPMCNLYKNNEYLGRVGRGGHVSVKLFDTTNFKIECNTVDGKKVEDSLTVNVSNVSVPQNVSDEKSKTAHVYFSSSNESVPEFTWFNLRWTGYGVRKEKPACQIFEGKNPIANVDFKGNWSVYPDKTNEFRIRCYDDEGKYAEAVKNISVTYDWETSIRSKTGTVKINISKNEIFANEPVTISWESEGARELNSCQLMIKKGSIITVGKSGSLKLTPTQSNEYKIRCMDDEKGAMFAKVSLNVKSDPKVDLYNANSKNAFARFTDDNGTVYAKRMSFLYWETNGVRAGGGGCQLYETDKDGEDKYITDIVRNGRWPVYPEITTTYTIKCYDTLGSYTTYSKTFFVKRF